MTILDAFARDPEHVLDRLVDGELSPHDHRELLAGLDDEPGAWRRCALAFLEAQSFRWQLSPAAAEPILSQVKSSSPKSPARQSALWGGGFLALAAGLAVAFVLGTRFPATLTLATGQNGLTTLPLADSTNPQNTRGATSAAAAQADAPWQTIRLTPVGGTGDPIELRVVDESKDPYGALASERSALSGQLSRSFEREGWQVDRRQGLLPIDLSDGRQLVVPIEEVDIRGPHSVQF